MVDPNSAKFISSLVKSLQMFCHGYMEFEDNIEIIGHINLRIDNRKKLDYIVNEQVSKQGQESTCFQSNSYHSVPPKSSERDPLHESVDSSMSVLSGTRVQVDLSGPSPVTRSTFASYADGFLSPLGSSQTYSQGRESQVETKQTLASGLKDTGSAAPVFNHSLIVNKETKRMGYVGVKDSGQADMNSSTPVSSDLNGQQQNLSGLLPGIVIKAEPGAFSSEKSGVSTSVSYSQPCTLPSLTFAQPVSFSASPAHLDTLGSERSEARQTGSGGSEGRTPPVSLAHSASASSPLNPCSTGVGPPQPSPTHPRSASTQGACYVGSNQGGSQSNSGSASVYATNMSSGVGSLHSQDVMSMPAVNNSRGWWCERCCKAFRSGDLLARHMQLVHRTSLTPASSGTGGQTARMTSPCQSSVLSPGAHADSEPLSLEPSLVPQGLLSEMLDVELLHTENKMNFSCSNTGLTSQTQYTDRTVKEFLPHTDDWWLQDHQNSTVNETSEPRIPDPSQPSASGGQGVWTTSNAFCANPSYMSTSQGFENMTSNFSSAPYNLSSPVSRLARMLAKPSGLAGRRAPSTGRRCRHCHKILRFVSNAQFVEHEEKCTREGGVGLACGQCGRSFGSRVALKDHVDSMHTKKGFQCRGCGMVFKWRTYVYQHRYKCAAYRIKREPL
ncbi:uncharacterized protein LOC143293554 isoform X1 [Babylonia areolata]|uniref:uncharacterized protein LOC143293554 isoform X1 n=1 Tax=Babylonia areolata TaxID=304850 RepID=UPI003FD51DDB